MDEEVIAWKTRQFWHGGKPFLIGGGTPFGVHLGPMFYYFSAIPLWTSQGDPIAWGVLAAITGTLTIWLMWQVGKSLFDEKVGLIAAFFWAISFPIVLFDRHWWPLVLDPLFSLLTVLSLFRVLKGHKRWWLVLGVTLSVAWQADLTNLILFVSTGVVAIIVLRHQWKYIIAAAGIVLLSLEPLVIFELRHPGANIGKLLTYQQVNHSKPLTPILDTIRFVPSTLGSLLLPGGQTLDLSRAYTWCKDIATSRISIVPIIMFIAGGIFLYPVIRFYKNRRPEDLVITLILISGTIGIFLFRLIGGDLFDFYLADLFPIFLIAASVALRFQRTTPATFATILIALAVFHFFAFAHASHPQSLALKQQAVAWVSQETNGQQFALDSLSRCHRYNGIRYLFMIGGKEPSMSFMDPSLSWLYGVPPSTVYPNLFVAFVTPQDLTKEDEERYNQLKRRAIAHKAFGDIDVVVSDNYDHSLTINF